MKRESTREVIFVEGDRTSQTRGGQLLHACIVLIVHSLYSRGLLPLGLSSPVFPNPRPKTASTRNINARIFIPSTTAISAPVLRAEYMELQSDTTCFCAVQVVKWLHTDCGDRQLDEAAKHRRRCFTFSREDQDIAIATISPARSTKSKFTKAYVRRGTYARMKCVPGITYLASRKITQELRRRTAAAAAVSIINTYRYHIRV